MSSFTIGSGTAHSVVNDGVSVQADGIGVFGGNFGTGTVDIDVGNNATVFATLGLGGVGIAALKLGDGNVRSRRNGQLRHRRLVWCDGSGSRLRQRHRHAHQQWPDHEQYPLHSDDLVDHRRKDPRSTTIRRRRSKSGGLPFSPIIATIGGQLTVNNSGDMADR